MLFLKKNHAKPEDKVMIKTEAKTKDLHLWSWFTDSKTSSGCDHKPFCMICPRDQLTRKCKFWYSSVAEDKLKISTSEPESVRESVSAEGA